VPRDGVHNEMGLVTLEQLLEIESDPITHHVRQIQEKREVVGLPAAS
jgi:hypothetical protein